MSQLSLFDQPSRRREPRVPHVAADTSRDAAERIARSGAASELRELVQRLLEAAGAPTLDGAACGMTCHELAEAVARERGRYTAQHHVTGRLDELYRQERAVPTRCKRRNPSGVRVRVWCAAEHWHANLGDARAKQ